MKNKIRSYKRSFIHFLCNHWVGGELGKPTSRRNRCKPRQLQTFQNKLSKLKSIYKRRVKASQRSKAVFNALSEVEQNKILKSHRQTHDHNKKEPKEFFCDRFPSFDSFLKVNVLKAVGRTEERGIVKTYSAKKVAGW